MPADYIEYHVSDDNLEATLKRAKHLRELYAKRETKELVTCDMYFVLKGLQAYFDKMSGVESNFPVMSLFR